MAHRRAIRRFYWRACRCCLVCPRRTACTEEPIRIVWRRCVSLSATTTAVALAAVVVVAGIGRKFGEYNHVKCTGGSRELFPESRHDWDEIHPASAGPIRCSVSSSPARFSASPVVLQSAAYLTPTRPPPRRALSVRRDQPRKTSCRRCKHFLDLQSIAGPRLCARTRQGSNRRWAR